MYNIKPGVIRFMLHNGDNWETCWVRSCDWFNFISGVADQPDPVPVRDLTRCVLGADLFGGNPPRLFSRRLIGGVWVRYIGSDFPTRRGFYVCDTPAGWLIGLYNVVRDRVPWRFWRFAYRRRLLMAHCYDVAYPYGFTLRDLRCVGHALRALWGATDE